MEPRYAIEDAANVGVLNFEKRAYEANCNGGFVALRNTGKWRNLRWIASGALEGGRVPTSYEAVRRCCKSQQQKLRNATAFQRLFCSFAFYDEAEQQRFTGFHFQLIDKNPMFLVVFDYCGSGVALRLN